ncbi:MAG TPA: DNA repair protein RecO [Bacteroidota bacterium]|nr:DNA repair protein RecO [Bacteroidota bacterium]
MIVKSEAIVLRTMKYRETSRIATLYTKEMGKISVIAKGARDRRSRLGGSLQAMSHVGVLFYWKESRDLQLLAQCDSARSHPGLTSDLDRMAAAMAAVELTDAVSPPQEANPALFELLSSTLEGVSCATNQPGNALYYFELHLLRIIGFRPDMRFCALCRNPVGPAAQGGGLRLTQNGIVCAACSAKGLGLETLSPAALAALQRLEETGDPATATRMVLNSRVRGEIAGVLRRFLLSHVEGMRTLRSEAVFSSIL